MLESGGIESRQSTHFEQREEPIVRFSRIYPPHYLAISVIIILALDVSVTDDIFTGWIPYLGLVPVLLGLCMTGYAALQFKRAKTNLVPFSESTTLVIKGLYRYTRNPMYVGMTLLLIGLAFLTNTPYGWLVVIVFPIIIHRLFIIKEEQQMIDTFGNEYLDYRERVRRWI